MTNLTNWLVTLNNDCIEKQWCSNFKCTTCGALHLRSTLISRALKNIGVENNSKTFKRVRPWDYVPSEYKEKVIENICIELNKLTRREGEESQIFKIVIMDIWYNLNQSTDKLKTLITDGWAREELESMDNHYNKYQNMIKEKMIYESPEMTTKRRSEKKQLKAQAHEERVQKYKNLKKEK